MAMSYNIKYDGNVDKFCSSGGFEELLKSLDSYADDATVRYALDIIRYCKDSIHYGRIQTSLINGGIAKILHILATNDSLEVKALALMTLVVHIQKSSENKAAVSRHSGIETLTELLTFQFHNILHQVLITLHICLLNNVQNQKIFADIGGFQMLFDVAKYPARKNITESSFIKHLIDVVFVCAELQDNFDSFWCDSSYAMLLLSLYLEGLSSSTKTLLQFVKHDEETKGIVEKYQGMIELVVVLMASKNFCLAKAAYSALHNWLQVSENHKKLLASTAIASLLAMIGSVNPLAQLSSARIISDCTITFDEFRCYMYNNASHLFSDIILLLADDTVRADAITQFRALFIKKETAEALPSSSSISTGPPTPDYSGLTKCTTCGGFQVADVADIVEYICGCKTGDTSLVTNETSSIPSEIEQPIKIEPEMILIEHIESIKLEQQHHEVANPNPTTRKRQTSHNRKLVKDNQPSKGPSKATTALRDQIHKRYTKRANGKLHPPSKPKKFASPIIGPPSSESIVPSPTILPSSDPVLSSSTSIPPASLSASLSSPVIVVPSPPLITQVPTPLSPPETPLSPTITTARPTTELLDDITNLTLIESQLLSFTPSSSNLTIATNLKQIADKLARLKKMLAKEEATIIAPVLQPHTFVPTSRSSVSSYKRKRDDEATTSDDENDSDFDAHQPNRRSRRPKKAVGRPARRHRQTPPVVEDSIATQQQDQGAVPKKRRRRRKTAPLSEPLPVQQLSTSNFSLEWSRELAEEFNKFTNNAAQSTTLLSSSLQDNIPQVKEETDPSPVSSSSCPILAPSLPPISPHASVSEFQHIKLEQAQNDQATNLLPLLSAPQHSHGEYNTENTLIQPIKATNKPAPNQKPRKKPAPKPRPPKERHSSNHALSIMTPRPFYDCSEAFQKLEQRMDQLLKMAILEWTVSDVETWLEYIGLHNHVKNFQQLGVNGMVLVGLCDDSLATTYLKMKHKCDRKVFLDELSKVMSTLSTDRATRESTEQQKGEGNRTQIKLEVEPIQAEAEAYRSEDKDNADKVDDADTEPECDDVLGFSIISSELNFQAEG